MLNSQNPQLDLDHELPTGHPDQLQLDFDMTEELPAPEGHDELEASPTPKLFAVHHSYVAETRKRITGKTDAMKKRENAKKKPKNGDQDNAFNPS